MSTQSLKTFEVHESEVRSYCRSYPVVFSKAKGSYLYEQSGERYIDFLSCAGAMNYGHNHDAMMQACLNYMQNDGILMSLDMHSQAKREFIETFRDLILVPRNLNYKLQFTSPTGTSVVESAVKLARKCTQRQNVIAFTNAFHGMTGNSLSLTGSRSNRQADSHGHVTRLPFDGYLGKTFNSVAFLRKLLEDNSSGVDLPAAIILETVQAEGGVNVASTSWLRELSDLAKQFGILLIIDDIQAGCGRTGSFFSFERADVMPDIVCLSKSIGAGGFPFAVLLMSPELDVWSAGEDNGTFRGNNLAFVASTAMLQTCWSNNEFADGVRQREDIVSVFSRMLARKYNERIRETRGIGLMHGIEFYSEDDTGAVVDECFKRKLVVESCGPRGQVLKLIPALNIPLPVLQIGLKVIEGVVSDLFGQDMLRMPRAEDEPSGSAVE